MKFMALIPLSCSLFPGGTEVITEDDYQNGHPDLEAASSGRLGVGRDKMVYMAVKNHPKEEEDDEDDSDEDEDDDISMFLNALQSLTVGRRSGGCCTAFFDLLNNKTLLSVWVVSTADVMA